MSQIQTQLKWCISSVMMTLIAINAGAAASVQAAERCPAGDLGCRQVSYVQDANENGNEISAELLHAYDDGKKAEENDRWDLKKMIPANLSGGQDPNDAASKIADKSFNYWYDQSALKQSSLGQGVDRASKSMQTDVAFGSPNSVQQKVNMGIDLFQTRAMLKYDGYAHAELFYQLRDSSAGLQLTKKLDATKDLVIGESLRASDAFPSSEVKWRWNW